MYNAFVSTTPRLRRHKKDDSPSTAGAAKVSGGGGKSKGELEALGQRHGWIAREISPEDVKQMGADELRYHELFNGANLQQALTLPDRIAANKAATQQWGAKRIWDDQASEMETQAAIQEVAKFTSRYPQFIGAHSANRDVLLGWLRDRNLPVDYAHLVDAFEANALEGRIALNPSAIACGSETEVSGGALTQHRNFHLLLQAQRRVNPDDHLSADEYKAAHTELHDTRVPPMILQAWNRAMATFVSMHPEFVNTNESRERIFAALRQSKVNVTIQAIEEVFHHLAKNGEVQIDGTKTVEGQAVRLTDLGGRR